MRTGVLVFAGPIGSGKTSLARRAAAELGCDRIAFSSVLKEAAAARNQKPTREVLQEIGADWAETNPRDLCASLLTLTKWKPTEPLVIDGLRHIAVADHLKSLVTPTRVWIVYVDASYELRRQRVIRESGKDLLSGWERHPSESHISELGPIADVVVRNDGQIDDAARALLEWLREG